MKIYKQKIKNKDLTESKPEKLTQLFSCCP